MRADDIAHPPEAIQPCARETCRPATTAELVRFFTAVALIVGIVCGAGRGAYEFAVWMGWWPL